MAPHRVIITGLGVISAIGSDRAAFWSAICDGRHGFTPLADAGFDQLRIRLAARVRDFDPAAHFEPKRLEVLDRFAQLALVAAREALRDAGLQRGGYIPHRAGVVLGSCMGGQTTQDNSFLDLYHHGKQRLNPTNIPRIMANAAASHICMEHEMTGPTYTVSTACSSSNHAIGQAFWLVRSGAADVVVTGGTEAPFSYGNLKAWEALRVVSPDLCRPFSVDRNGMLLGEGAGILVLESLEHARRRGAQFYAEIAGFGMSADAHHLVQPSVAGASQAMKSALDDASLDPEDIDYINGHGTGTVTNDVTEVASIRGVFGAHAEKLPVSSTKSMHGHALGASGGLEAVALTMAIRDGVLPPTANFSAPDPECALDVVPNHARRRKIRAALSNSFAFGGLNAVLVLRSSDAL